MRARAAWAALFYLYELLNGTPAEGGYPTRTLARKILVTELGCPLRQEIVFVRNCSIYVKTDFFFLNRVNDGLRQHGRRSVVVICSKQVLLGISSRDWVDRKTHNWSLSQGAGQQERPTDAHMGWIGGALARISYLESERQLVGWVKPTHESEIPNTEIGPFALNEGPCLEKCSNEEKSREYSYPPSKSGNPVWISEGGLSKSSCRLLFILAGFSGLLSGLVLMQTRHGRTAPNLVGAILFFGSPIAMLVGLLLVG